MATGDAAGVAWRGHSHRHRCLHRRQHRRRRGCQANARRCRAVTPAAAATPSVPVHGVVSSAASAATAAATADIPAGGHVPVDTGGEIPRLGRCATDERGYFPRLPAY